MTADFAEVRRGAEALQALSERLEGLRSQSIATAHRILGDRNQAEDAVQDAYVRATESLHTLLAPEKLTSWFRQIVVRCSLDALSVRKNSSLLTDNQPARERVTVQWALDELTPEQQIVLALAFGEGLSHKEIAETLDIPMGTVASRIHSAKAAFKKVWEASHD